MSWIKPNFLWMQYRSGWSSKPGQEVTLAIRLQRTAFDSMLAMAVHSTYKSEFVREQYEAVRAEDYEWLVTPREMVYPQPPNTEHMQISPYGIETSEPF